MTYPQEALTDAAVFRAVFRDAVEASGLSRDEVAAQAQIARANIDAWLDKGSAPYSGMRKEVLDRVTALPRRS